MLESPAIVSTSGASVRGSRASRSFSTTPMLVPEMNLEMMNLLTEAHEPEASLAR